MDDTQITQALYRTLVSSAEVVEVALDPEKGGHMIGGQWLRLSRQSRFKAIANMSNVQVAHLWFSVVMDETELREYVRRAAQIEFCPLSWQEIVSLHSQLMREGE